MSVVSPGRRMPRRVAGIALRMSDSPRQRIPGYLAVMSTFGLGSTVAAVAAARRGDAASRYELQDVVLGALATHKFTRLASKDGVSTPIRAPFTEFDGEAGSAEVNEHPRGDHLRHTIGELLVCPFCLAPWVAGGYVAALNLSPRLARAWAATFSIVGASDFLQQAYARVRTD